MITTEKQMSPASDIFCETSDATTLTDIMLVIVLAMSFVITQTKEKRHE